MRTVNNWINNNIIVFVILFAGAAGYIIYRLNFGIENGTKQREIQIENQEVIKQGVDSINAKIDHQIIDSLKDKLE